MSLPRSNFPGRRSTIAWVLCLSGLCVLCVSVVSKSHDGLSTETETAQSFQREFLLLAAPQGPELDYSTFKHNSQKHASLACNSCHQRGGDNSATPHFPGHKACTGCHVGQFVTPAVPMCVICHTEVSSSNPPLRLRRLLSARPMIAGSFSPGNSSPGPRLSTRLRCKTASASPALSAAWRTDLRLRRWARYSRRLSHGSKS